ncbi:Aste57867_19950 [Aphanomyces stellatus]|uniref:Aste57867_19950 protein n=1 Tax=Aphanomyces stellatus TaxID=120398 RepID=A0A485LEE7_9STRA|nr:hypothetical protein As57867_019884 [Aphanomyces stellatus]VFT96647.1 Aste57867_19950 [Aphanomyces stellatus]
MSDGAAATPAAACSQEKDCLAKKAVYDQCFDVWYRDVFLQNKSGGKLGCEELYKEYAACMTDELKPDTGLVQSIRSEMNASHAGIWIGKHFPQPKKDAKAASSAETEAAKK